MQLRKRKKKLTLKYYFNSTISKLDPVLLISHFFFLLLNSTPNTMIKDGLALYLVLPRITYISSIKSPIEKDSEVILLPVKLLGLELTS